MKNNKSAKDAAQNRKQDYGTNKVLLVFTLSFALLMFLMNIGRMMKNIRTYATAASTAQNATWILLGTFAVGVIIAIIERICKRDLAYKLFTGVNLAVVSLFSALCTALVGFYSTSPDMLMLLYVLIPTVAVLYIIYYSYQHEFFALSLAAAVGAVGIYAMRSSLLKSISALIIAGVAVTIVLLAVFTIMAQRSKGSVSLFGRKFSPFAPDSKYTLIYITFALVIALLAATIIIPAYASYYIFGLIAYIVLTGIYYTIKLI